MDKAFPEAEKGVAVEQFSYRVYGLRLRSNQPIPGLVAFPQADKADIEICFGSMPHWLENVVAEDQRIWYTSLAKDQEGRPVLSVWKLVGGAYLRMAYRDRTEFVIERGGAGIWAIWPDEYTLEDVSTYLLGPVLGVILRLRGTTCLHASAIAVDGKAIALMGPAEAGKSTTAAALAARGFPVLSDDIVTLSEGKGTFLVHPGYPLLRLWPDSAETIWGPAHDLPRLTPTWDKRYMDLTQEPYRFQSEPLPLGAVYMLDYRRGDEGSPTIQDVPAATAFVSLISNTYSNLIPDPEMRAREFDVLHRMLACTPLRRVIPRADRSRLPQLVDAILSDFQTVVALKN